MPVPPKKLQAFMQNESRKKLPFGKKGKKFGEEEEDNEGDKTDEGGEQDEGGEDKKGGNPFGKGGGGGAPGAKGGKDYSQMVSEEAKKVTAGEVDQELMDYMATFDPEDNPPEWAAQPDIWMKAEEAVDPEGKGAQYDEPYAVVAHVYKRMGGKIKGSSSGGGDKGGGNPFGKGGGGGQF